MDREHLIQTTESDEVALFERNEPDESDPAYEYDLAIDCEEIPVTIDCEEIPVNDNSDMNMGIGNAQMTLYLKTTSISNKMNYILVSEHNSQNINIISNTASQYLLSDNIIEENTIDDDSKSSSNGILDQQIDSDAKTSTPKIEWNFEAARKIDEDGGNLLIGNSMTICDESSDDKSVDTAVEEIEPTIQNLELDQKFNDAESYLIESGEISGDGGGKKNELKILVFPLFLD